MGLMHLFESTKQWRCGTHQKQQKLRMQNFLITSYFEKLKFAIPQRFHDKILKNLDLKISKED